MLDDIIDMLECTHCCQGDLTLEVFERTGGGIVKSGTLSCAKCQNWYKIDEGVVDLMPLEMRDNDKYVEFARKWNLPNIVVNVKNK